jgi:sporulation protein YlmC with PRC-barrel domain
MAEITLVIGTTAHCSDGFPGEVKSVVIDPGARAVTHLVVEPRLEHGTAAGLARLVPLDHVDATADEIGLRYTGAEFKDLSPAEETLAEFVPGLNVPVQLLPSGEGWRDADGPVVDGGTIPQIREMETVPVLPTTGEGETEVEEHRGDHVHATDGDIGELRGLRIDSSDGHVTQLLLKEGHLWDRKEVAIPIGNVSGFDAGIRLNLTKQQVRDLPPADIDRPGR